MNPRLRSALLLLATLIMGMVLGALIHSSISGHRMKRGRGMLRTEDTFIASYEKTIEPNSEQQAAEIRMVLLATAPEVITLVKNNQASVRKHLDEMKLQLEPILDEDQKLRLEERYNRRRQRDLEKK